MWGHGAGDLGAEAGAAAADEEGGGGEGEGGERSGFGDGGDVGAADVGDAEGGDAVEVANLALEAQAPFELASGGVGRRERDQDVERLAAIERFTGR